VRHARTGHVEHAVDVRVDDAAPLVGIDLPEIDGHGVEGFADQAHADSRVVDECVQSATTLQDSIGEGLAAFEITDVGGEADHAVFPGQALCHGNGLRHGIGSG
jgi:hypothetical protein